MSERKQTNLAGIAAISCVALAATLIQRYACVDDAYVSFVYARNLADGAGLVFNPGERIEGYSNFLWVAILSLCELFKEGSIPRSSQSVGIFLAVCNALLVYSLARRVIGETSKIWAVSAALVTALDLRIAVWSVEGLETPLYLFLVLASLRLYYSDRFRWICGATCLGAALTRPEGPLLAAVLFVHRAWALARERERPRAGDYAALALFALPYTAYTMWRMAYFGGGIFPNTFYARGNAGPAVGALYILIELYRGWGVAAPFVVGIALYGALKTRLETSAATIWTAAAVAAVVAVGGDWMPNARFLVPILPFLFILAAAGCAKMRSGAAGAAIMALLAALQIGGVALYEIRPSFEKQWARHQDTFYMPVAKKLDELGARGELVAFSDIGYVGYHAGVRIIDTLGLVDRHLSRMPDGPQWNTDLDYVLDRKPAFTVNMVRDYGKIEIGHTAFDRAALNNERYAAEYAIVEIVPGYEASEMSWDDWARHDYEVEFLIWKRK